VNWEKAAHLGQFGGVRIEDDVRVTTDEPENLTRNAFAEL
jgi:Xaa-Pro dipeptidase